MTTGAEIVIREAGEQGLASVSAFMCAQQKMRNSEAYLRHWYFRNPVPGGSLVIGEREGRIVGMATMNAHHFVRNYSTALVAMPQKVLTDPSLRGQGVFGRLYRHCEKVSIERHADLFLTVTNAASTDIFLRKFGYVRLPSPLMAVMMPLPGRPQARPLSAEDKPMAPTSAGPSWHMTKDETHLQWRYLDHPLREYIMVRCALGPGVLGDLFLKRIRKKGLPVMLVMEMTASDPAVLPELLRTARRLSWQHRCVALLCLTEARFKEAIAKNGPMIRRTSGFNLLVKGLGPAHTSELAQQPFEISFGDLDFF